MVYEVLPVLTIAVLFPELLGTYGDGGNGVVLLERARRRGIDASLVVVRLNENIPEASLYVLGGGEDGPQRLACDLLVQSSFVSRVQNGAHVFAVCAGLQLLGHTFSVEGNESYAGLGLVDATTHRGEHRSVGEIAVMVGEHLLVGFENHGGRTALGENVRSLGSVVTGRGNDGISDGFRTERVWATYAHGPVLAMNPWLADQVLSTTLRSELSPLATVADRLYMDRCAALNLGSGG